MPLSSGDKTFGFSQNAFCGWLGWMELVTESLTAARVGSRDGVTVGFYQVTIPAETAQTRTDDPLLAKQRRGVPDFANVLVRVSVGCRGVPIRIPQFRVVRSR